MNDKIDPILRERQVRSVTGLGRSARWTLEREGQFPKRVKLTSRAVGWKSSEISAWINGRERACSADSEPAMT